MFNTFLDIKRRFAVIIFWWLFIVITIVTAIAIYKWAFPMQVNISLNQKDVNMNRQQQAQQMVNILCNGKGTYSVDWQDQTNGELKDMICNY